MRWDRCVMVVELFVCFVPSSWGIFVYKLETFIDIRIVSLPTFVFSMKMIKSSGILRIGLLQLQHKLGQCLHDRGYSLGRAVATWDYRSTDRYVYFRELIEYWYTRRIGSLWKPSLGHVINVFSLTHFFWMISLTLFCMFFTIGALRGCGYSWWLLYLCLLFWGLTQNGFSTLLKPQPHCATNYFLA